MEGSFVFCHMTLLFEDCIMGTWKSWTWGCIYIKAAASQSEDALGMLFPSLVVTRYKAIKDQDSYLRWLEPESRVLLMNCQQLSVSTWSSQIRSHTDSSEYETKFWTVVVNTYSLVLPRTSVLDSSSGTWQTLPGNPGNHGNRYISYRCGDR